MSIDAEAKAICAEVFRLLKEEREKRGLSKYALAAKSGISQQAIGYIERGMTSPALDTVIRISRAMDIELADLLRTAQNHIGTSPPKQGG